MRLIGSPKMRAAGITPNACGSESALIDALPQPMTVHHPQSDGPPLSEWMAQQIVQDIRVGNW
ncbi:MAG: hypothetical protein IT331_24240 [Anaerolineae bacterium]|nr:hypothetical protein [Anaerolineae bacterium]